MPCLPPTTKGVKQKAGCFSQQKRCMTLTRLVLGSGRLVGVLLRKLLQALFKPVHHSRLHKQARVVQVVYDKLLGSRLGLVQAQDVFACWLVTALRGMA